MYANQVATEVPDVLVYCWSQMAIPEFGDGDGDGGGGGAVEEVRLDDDGGDEEEEEVIDAESVVIVEVVGDTVAAPDAPDCISPITPARAEVTEAGNAVEPDGDSICVSGQDPSLFA